MGSMRDLWLLRRTLYSINRQRNKPFTKDELTEFRGPGTRAARVVLAYVNKTDAADLGRILAYSGGNLMWAPDPHRLFPEEAELITNPPDYAERVVAPLRGLRLQVAAILLVELGGDFDASPRGCWGELNGTSYAETVRPTE